MEIDVFNEGVSLPFRGVTKRKIKTRVARICTALSLDDTAVAIILTGNDYIKEINRKYRRRNKPTDVISFAYREQPFPGTGTETEQLGDIYLSLEKALEQSAEYGVSFDEEISRLLVHGMLHLIGYDHERSKKAEREMKEKEEDIMTGLTG